VVSVPCFELFRAFLPLNGAGSSAVLKAGSGEGGATRLDDHRLDGAVGMASSASAYKELQALRHYAGVGAAAALRGLGGPTRRA
jgi:hypothetical protein